MTAKWLNYDQFHKEMMDRWPNWFKVIKHYKEQQVILFEIHATDDFGAFKEPFYLSSSIEWSGFPLIWALSDLIFADYGANPCKNYQNHSKELSSTYTGNTKVATAALSITTKCNKICASHPNYGIIYYNIYQTNNKEYIDFERYFFIKHSVIKQSYIFNKQLLKRDCIATVNETWALIKMNKYKTKIKPKRIKHIVSDESIRQFPFVEAYKVGKVDQNTVYLSNIENDVNSICIVKGIMNINTAFVQHPSIIGSKDHLNTHCLQDINYQFCNLIVRTGL
eukprot:349375_1